MTNFIAAFSARQNKYFKYSKYSILFVKLELTSNELQFMSENIPFFIQTTISKVLLLLTIIVSIICVLGRTINVYDFAAVGAIFEILWLPILALLFVLPIAAFIYWMKDKFNVRSLNLYALLIVLSTIIFTTLYQ